MPEQIVWNKKLILIAMVLGLLAVVMFFLYDARQQKRLTGTYASVLQWTRDMQAGDVIQKEDIRVVPVRRDLVKEMGGTIIQQGDQHAGLAAAGETVQRAVLRNHFVLADDLQGSGDTKSALDRLGAGKVAIALRLDPYYTLGDAVKVNGKVDVMGRLGNPPKTYILIQNLRILAIGGRSQEPEDRPQDGRRSSDSGMRVYRNIVVEMSPSTAEKWMDLEARLYGGIRLLGRNPTASVDPKKGFDGVINPDVLKLMETLQPVEGYDR